MDPEIEMAFVFASDLAKQLISLATGILALTITFTKDILKGVPSGSEKTLTFAWLIYLVSIVFGIWSLMALTGTLAPTAPPEIPEPLTIGGNARIPAALQIISFIVGTLLIIRYGAVSIGNSRGRRNTTEASTPKAPQKQ